MLLFAVLQLRGVHRTGSLSWFLIQNCLAKQRGLLMLDIWWRCIPEKRRPSCFLGTWVETERIMRLGTWRQKKSRLIKFLMLCDMLERVSSPSLFQHHKLFTFPPLGDVMHCQQSDQTLYPLLPLACNLSNLILWVTHWKPLALWYWQFQRGHCQQRRLRQENATPGTKRLHSPLVPSVPWSCRVTLCTQSTNISICSKLRDFHLHKCLADLLP